MSSKKKIYCVYCGTENLYNDDHCKKCKKELNPKNHLFRDFLYDHIKGDLKGNIEDNIFSLIKNFIISHLYGSSLIISVLFTTTVLVISNLNYHSSVTNITSVQDMLNNRGNSSSYTITLYTYDDYCTATFEAPTTTGYFITGDKYKLATASIEKGSTLAKWCEKNSQNLLCKEQLRLIGSDIEKTANEYKALLDEYVDWYQTCKDDRTSTTCSTQYIDYNDKLDDYMYRLTSERKNDNNFFDMNTKIDKNINLYIPIVESCDIIGGSNEVQ